MKTEIKKDFKKFLNSLNHCNSQINTYYLYGRDLNSVGWYSSIFFNKSDFREITIIKCKEAYVFESKFDWARFVNKRKLAGRKHYEHVEMLPGRFFNLIIPEVYRDGPTLYDLDELEVIILSHLSEPVAIGSLIQKMHSYADEEVIKNHIEQYQELIISFLKDLVLKKAVKPF